MSHGAAITDEERALLHRAGLLVADIIHRVSHGPDTPQANVLGPLLFGPLGMVALAQLSSIAIVRDDGSVDDVMGDEMHHALDSAISGCEICQAKLRQSSRTEGGH